MFLNGGVNPNTDATIIPSAEFEVITSAHSIMSPSATTAQISTEVYGLGWARLSFVGHDVSESYIFYPVRDIMLANRSFGTTAVHLG
jgi:hypothetical protein